MSTQLYAHSQNEDSKWHILKVHLEAVAKLAGKFASQFGMKEAAEIVGWIHDIGKAFSDWQNYLELSSDGKWPQGKKSPPHAIVGSLLLQELDVSNGSPDGPLLCVILSLVCSCHHTGLQDLRATYKKRIKAAMQDELMQRSLREARAFWAELSVPRQETLPGVFKDKDATAFAVRMLHSCLVDADCLDTEAHFQPEATDLRSPGYKSIEELSALLLADQERFAAPTTSLDQHRREMYLDAMAASESDRGFYSLSVPTGGGKTRTGMAFALKHAAIHGMDRVIVAIPYTSIIEQNAEVYRQIFGVDQVLEHHSNLFASEDTLREHFDQDATYEEHTRWRRMAAQNWDAPIVVTTNVQFFESLFASRNGKLRKLHHIANSVIVLDEVQTLKPELLDVTLRRLMQLKEHYGCSVVFSTATQPAFSKETLGSNNRIEPIEHIQEIIQEPERHSEALQRVSYHYPTDKNDTISFLELAEFIVGHEQVLVILNTVDDAHTCFDMVLDELPDSIEKEGLIHLSTRLCGQHRREQLAKVKARLDAGQPCRLISTQVVEAGVDIDFPVVYRAMAPLDSLIQAAGRCNREGKLGPAGGQVHIFQAEGTKLPGGAYTTGTDATRSRLAEEKPSTLDTASLCTSYFRELYSLKNNKKDVKIREHEQSWDFPASSKEYRLIDEVSHPVILEHAYAQEVACLLEKAETYGLSRRLTQQLQPYIVNLRPDQFKHACDVGWIQEKTFVKGSLFLWSGQYDQHKGLCFEAETQSMLCP